MANEMTDKLQLVQSATVKGFLGLFGRNLSVAEGFSLEVFRGDTYLGSILSNDIKVAGDVKKRCERLGARDGDTILRVNLGPRTLTLSGRLYTQDGYTRAYEIVCELHVSNPALFAQCYRQQSDPFMLASTAIEGEFQRYAERNKHDAMDIAKLRLDAEHTLDITSNQRFGLSVTRAHKSYLWLDPKHAQKLETWQQADVEQTKLQANAEVDKTRATTTADVTLVQKEREAEIQNFLDENDEKRVSRAADFIRVEEAKQQAHIRQQALFGTTAQEIMEALSTRIREEIALGRPLSEIFNDYPQLRDIFLPPERTLPNAARQSLPGPADRGDSANTADNASFSIQETGPQPVVKPRNTPNTQPGSVREATNSIIHDTHLGVTLMPKTLSTEELQKLKLKDERVFVVWEIDNGGPAQKAHLNVLDMLVEVNGEPLCDALALTEILDESEPDTPVKVRLYRAGNPLEVWVEIA